VDSLDRARSLGWAVARLLAYVPGDTRCLIRSLVLTRLLARRGIEAKLVIGARATPEFSAHAWVEHDGVPVLDPGDESFGRLVEL
jgi:transglutaminase superfamily protein